MEVKVASALLSEILTAFLQVGIVLFLALVVRLAIDRTGVGFWAGVGLKRAPWKPVLIGATGGGLLAAALVLTPGVATMATGKNSIVGEAGRGAYAVLAIIALFKTSLSEEILFRGLIGKRLIAWLGFQWGNGIQAVLFGLMHLVLLLVPTMSTLAVMLAVAMTGTGGWLSGWLNERMGQGSILPSWAAHGTANLVAYWSFAAMAG